MKRKKVLCVFGTRPEAIKLAPLIKELKGQRQFTCRVCVTSQHTTLLHDVLRAFRITPHYDLNLMRDNQKLDQLHARVLTTMETVLEKEKPSLVIVQGDTTSAFCAALAAFYKKIPLAHIEAGLRSFDKYLPFPEEINRRLISVMTDFHFCPTVQARTNLRNEGVAAKSLFVVGNTVLDALRLISSKKKRFSYGPLQKFCGGKEVILVTLHRRETWGKHLEMICRTLKRLAADFDDYRFVFPVHPNPKVNKTVRRLLGKDKRFFICPALTYPDFVLLMNRSYLVLTDSGGVQEEAPSLNKPVVVLRDVTERPEIIKSGAAVLAGTDPEKIARITRKLLSLPQAYRLMTGKKNPYGDGHASQKIVSIIKKAL